jgi:hypothetical protein
MTTNEIKSGSKVRVENENGTTKIIYTNPDGSEVHHFLVHCAVCDREFESSLPPSISQVCGVKCQQHKDSGKPDYFENKELNSLLINAEPEVQAFHEGPKEWITARFDTEHDAELFVDWVGCRYDLRCDINPSKEGGWSVEVYP